jgi:type I restriction enzyme S subunit
MEELEVPLPPLAEQQRIVEKIEAIFATLDTMEQAILLQKAESSTCYEEILRKSLEGK